ncbi:MAG: succinate dehydrogenase, hydrophobic membrane anchor protein [Pseudomonadota bacterium]
MSSHELRTPLGRVRGLGSAKEGVTHHIRQRVSAIALIFLVPWFVYSVSDATGGAYEDAVSFIGHPINAILLILTVGAAFYHMRLGMQVVIEDYISKTGTRQALLILNSFVTIALFAASALSVLKIWIDAP